MGVKLGDLKPLHRIPTGGLMTRRIRALLALLALTFAFSVSACADSTAPQPECDTQGPWTC